LQWLFIRTRGLSYLKFKEQNIEFSIKKYDEKYKEDILQLFKLVDKEFIPTISDRGFDNCIKEIFAKNVFVQLAVYQEKVVGVISYIKNNNFVYVDWLMDHPSFRHHRVASILLEECIIKAKKEKFKYVKIKTWSTNEKALCLYQELGFNIIDSVSNDRGNGVDTVELKLVF